MRGKTFDLGPGRVHVLDRGDDIGGLAARLRRLIPARMAEIWADPPGALRATAERAQSAGFRGWIEAAMSARCSLEVYDTRDFPRRAFLAFDFGERMTAGGMLPWRVLVDCLGDAARQVCPPSLAHVHAAIGGLCLQYGGSGTLISPVELEPLSRVPWIDPALQATPAVVPVRLKDWLPFYECDGDYLACDPGGRARWFGHEWGDPAELATELTVEECVDDLFAVLTAQSHFDMRAQLELRPQRARP